jgi:hypothetical protein
MIDEPTTLENQDQHNDAGQLPTPSNGPQYHLKTYPNTNEPRVTPGRSGLKNWTPLVSTS